MSSNHGRSGVRRSGDDYQDIVALETMVDFLEHPSRYQWIQVEADDKGYLDDIVALRDDGSFEVKQVKYSVYAERDTDNWTWEKLLYREEGKSSLLEKWILSLEEIRKQGQIFHASVETNRKVSEEISNILDQNNHVDFKRIDADVTKRIVSQVGKEELVAEFFGVFQFNVDRPGLEELEEAVRRRFHNSGVTEEGWRNLKNQLRSWIRKKSLPEPEGKITLEHIKHSSFFHQFRFIYEEFPVPEDFVIPSEDFHRSLLEELQNNSNGCIVISASPGTGKSTYLSYLYNQFRLKGTPIIRHHYFISSQDRTPRRFDHRRVAESLMSQIQVRYLESIGRLGHKNADYHNLPQWLEACGSYWREKGKSLVVIIDGIDHVWRERRSVDELNDLFDYLLPPHEGILVIVCTQPIEDDKIPANLSLVAPRIEWKVLPNLELRAMKKWIRHHEGLMKLPSESLRRNNILDRVAEEFHRKSDGHPLYLRYSIRSITENELELNLDTVRNLPVLPHTDLTNYYKGVQAGLSETAKQILHLFSITPFAWTTKGIIECLESTMPDTSKIIESLHRIRYLLKEEANGWVIFHNSLVEFLKEHLDHVPYSNKLRSMLLKWLKERAPGYIRESYLWLISAESGNDEPLINGPTRDWVVDSVSQSLRNVSEILSNSAISALRKGRLERCSDINFLISYFNNARDFRSHILDDLFYTQLNINDDPHFQEVATSYLNEKSSKQLLYVAEMNKKNQSLVEKCLVELMERQRGNRFTSAFVSEDRFSVFNSLIHVAALCNETNLQNLVDKLIDQSFQGTYPHPLEILSNALRIFNRTPIILDLLKVSVPQEYSYIILKHAILLSFEEGFDLTQEVLENRSHPFAAIYGYMKRLSEFSTGSMTFPAISLFNITEGEQYLKKNQIIQAFYDLFFTLLANHLWGREKENRAWLSRTQLDPWPRLFIDTFNKASEELADLIRRNSAVPFNWLYDKVSGIGRPTWPEDRNNKNYGDNAESAVNKIAFDLSIILNKKSKPEIQLEELSEAWSSCYYSRWIWLDEYAAFRRCLLSEESLMWMEKALKSEVGGSIELFSDRAWKYSQIARILALHGKKAMAKDYVQEAANNLLTYGDHKDILLFGVLDVLRDCFDAGVSEAKEWLERIIPAVTHVEQFTDGDETNHLPSELGELLAKYQPELLPGYYGWLQEQEKYHHALHTFNSFLKYADLEDPLVQSVAKTAVDEESLVILSQRKNEGVKGAKDVLSSIRELLGKRAVDKAQKKSEESRTEMTSRDWETKDPPNPAEYPPQRFKDYINNADSLLYSPDSIERWINHWRNTPNKEKAYLAITEVIKKGTRLREYDSLFDFSFSLKGKKEAYQWLVEANVEGQGWSPYWARKEKAIHRWKTVKDHYPDKWLDFIIDTLEPFLRKRWGYSTTGFVRLVEYCFFMEKPELAKKISNQAINTTLELISPLELPKPQWFEEE